MLKTPQNLMSINIWKYNEMFFCYVVILNKDTILWCLLQDRYQGNRFIFFYNELLLFYDPSGDESLSFSSPLGALCQSSSPTIPTRRPMCFTVTTNFFIIRAIHIEVTAIPTRVYIQQASRLCSLSAGTQSPNPIVVKVMKQKQKDSKRFHFS